MRRKLTEQNWSEIEKQDSNRTQTWRRIRDQSIRAISDLTLLARKIPEDKQDEIFGTKRIDELVISILRSRENYPSPNVLSRRKAELAAVLVERSINMNIFHYQKLEQDTPSLIEPTINHLKQTISICDDVSYKLRLKNVEREAEIMKHRYLFSWNNMLGKEKNRLLDFILSKTANEPIQIIWSTLQHGNREIQFDFELGNELSKEIFQSTFQIKLNNTNTSAEVNIFSDTRGMLWEGNLLAKESGNYYSTTWTGDHFVKPNIDFNLYTRMIK
jgi:hypothetical protein